MNDLVVNDGHVIPLFARPRPVGMVNKLKPALSAWDNATGSSATGTARPDPPPSADGAPPQGGAAGGPARAGFRGGRLPGAACKALARSV
jgi:hypothetical protein